MGKHDHAYKILFAHPRMVRDLLEGFADGEWLSQLDFDTLERVNDTYVSDGLRSRADDIVWRIRCSGHDVYLLFEFQSKNEPFMTVRVLAYEGLLYQDLIRTRRIECGDELPAVLPIVLYNGHHRWTAPEDLASLLPSGMPKELDRYAPRCRYLLIDEGRYADADLLIEGNIAATLFRLENCRDPERIPEMVKGLRAWLERAGHHDLHHAFGIWFSKVFSVRFGANAQAISKLWEDQTMLEERLDEWEEEFLRRGRQQGEVTLLTRFLRGRFGELPSSVCERLNGASSDQLEHWSDRVFHARELNDVFDS